MWALIDRERMFLIHRHPSLECINNLDYIEAWDCATITLEDTHLASFNDFSDYEIKMLYENLCGQKYQGYNRDKLLEDIAAEIAKVPATDALTKEAYNQASWISLKRDGCYKYVKGASTAREMEDLFRPPALVSVNGFEPKPGNNYVPKKKVQIINTIDIVSDNPHLTNEVKQPRAPREPSSGPVEAPRTGSKTGLVWEIANAAYEELGAQADPKKLRELVKTRCEAQGVNSSTMSVQFSKWKTTKFPK